MVAASDYYAQGNKDLATETALTVQRLEPVCSLFTTTFRIFMQTVYIRNIVIWLNFNLIYPSLFSELVDCLTINHSEVV